MIAARYLFHRRVVMAAQYIKKLHQFNIRDCYWFNNHKNFLIMKFL